MADLRNELAASGLDPDLADERSLRLLSAVVRAVVHPEPTPPPSEATMRSVNSELVTIKLMIGELLDRERRPWWRVW